MRAKVQRWGNSLAVRIPKSFAQEIGLAADSQVDMHIVDGSLLVEPVAVSSLALDELLAAVTDDNLHGEADSGLPMGDEVW